MRSAAGECSQTDRADVFVVGAAAAAQDAQVREVCPELGVVLGEFDRITTVEILGLVELGMAES